MLTRQTLNSVQSGTEEELYSDVTNVALHIATGGYLNSANRLLSALWKYKMPHGRSTWLPDIAFMVLWNASREYPNFIPFEVDDIDSIEKNIRGYIAMDKWAYKMPDRPWQEMSSQDLLRNALITARLIKGDGSKYIAPESVLNPEFRERSADFSDLMSKVGEYVDSLNVRSIDLFPPPSVEMEALAMLQKMVAEGHFDFNGLVLGAELAARQGQRETAIQFAKLWAEKTVERDMGLGFPPIATCRHVAPLLLESVVARELGLSDAAVEEYLGDFLKVLDKRMTLGRSLSYGDLSWRHLVGKISKEAIRIEGEEIYDEFVRESEWIGFAGAEAKAIILAEERLNVTLPEDYRCFLEATDGIRGFPMNNPAFLPVARINYLKDVIEPYLFDIIVDYHMGGGDREALSSHLSDAIIICDYPNEELVWLMPEDNERSKWEAWFYAPWYPGVHVYPSFRYYIEEQLTQIQAYTRVT